MQFNFKIYLGTIGPNNKFGEKHKLKQLYSWILFLSAIIDIGKRQGKNEINISRDDHKTLTVYAQPFRFEVYSRKMAATHH